MHFYVKKTILIKNPTGTLLELRNQNRWVYL